MLAILHAGLLRCKLIAKRPVEAVLLLLLLPLAVYLATIFLPSQLGTEGIPVALVDQDQSPYSRLVLERVSQEPLVQALFISEEEARRLILQGRLETAFIIKEGFMEKLKQGERRQIIEVVHAPSSLSVALMRELVGREVIRLASNAQAANVVQKEYLKRNIISTDEAERLWHEAWEHTDEYWEPEPLMSIIYREFPLFPSPDKSREQTEATLIEENPEQNLEAVYQDVAASSLALEREQLVQLFGWLAAFIMLLAIFLQHWLVEERKEGLLSRIRGCSSKPVLYVLGSSLPMLLFLILELGLSLLVIHWQTQQTDYLGVSLLTNALLLSLLFIYTLFCFCFALALALMVRTNAQLQGLGVTVVLLTSIFGGAFVPLKEWTAGLHSLALFTPQEWLLRGIRAGLSGATTWSNISPSLAVLTILLLCAFFLAMWRWQRLDASA